MRNWREKYEEVIKKEQDYSNPGAPPFHPIESSRKAKTTPTEIEISEVDAWRINELKDKKRLTDEEKKELELRERAELFISVDEESDSRATNWVGLTAIKEAFYPVYTIEGVVDGKMINLEKHVYPDFTPEELAQESANRDPFNMRDWMGKIKSTYNGKISGKSISQVEASRLFTEYESIAKKRSKEIRDLKTEKEKGKYGREIKGAYPYRVVDSPDI